MGLCLMDYPRCVRAILGFKKDPKATFCHFRCRFQASLLWNIQHYCQILYLFSVRREWKDFHSWLRLLWKMSMLIRLSNSNCFITSSVEFTPPSTLFPLTIFTDKNFLIHKQIVRQRWNQYLTSCKVLSSMGFKLTFW